MCKFCCTVDSHVRYNHCKLLLPQVLFSSIFWLFVVWLICILKQYLLIKNYWLGHANRSSPYTSAVHNKRHALAAWDQHRIRTGVFSQHTRELKIVFQNHNELFLVYFTPCEGKSSCNSAQYCNWDWFRLYFNQQKSPDICTIFFNSCPVCCFSSQALQTMKNLTGRAVLTHTS